MSRLHKNKKNKIVKKLNKKIIKNLNQKKFTKEINKLKTKIPI